MSESNGRDVMAGWAASDAAGLMVEQGLDSHNAVLVVKVRRKLALLPSGEEIIAAMAQRMYDKYNQRTA